MGSYRFEINGIEWPAGAPSDLPETAHIWLPGWLVEGESINDQQWDDMINDELEEMFNARAVSFGFEPDDEEDD